MINKQNSTTRALWLYYMTLFYGALGGVSLYSLTLAWTADVPTMVTMVFYCVMSAGSLTVAGLLALRSWRYFRRAAETVEGE